MLSLNLRRLCLACDKVFTRNIRTRRLGAPGANPGIDRRVNAFRKEGLQIEEDDAEEFVEHSESDFYKIDESYNEHLSETLMGKHDLRHKIVKEKYFKENMPNLLTWSEKEQIRHLATTNPDEWTPEKIAESFPVTAAVVKKLLKYPWKPATAQRIARHDTSAMRNWRELKEGSLDIPEDLKQHFLKYSERQIPPLNHSSIKVEVKHEEDLGEFERIVQRCAARENSTENPEKEPVQSTSITKQTFDKNRMTLNELTERIQKRLEKGNEVDVPDKMIYDTVKSYVPDIVINTNSEIELESFDKEEKQLTNFKEKEDKLELPNYPERIRIPKKAYKKGATYKVNDCYYDHDGKFLYRVMGMSN